MWVMGGKIEEKSYRYELKCYSWLIVCPFVREFVFDCFYLDSGVIERPKKTEFPNIGSTGLPLFPSVRFNARENAVNNVWYEMSHKLHNQIAVHNRNVCRTVLG